MALHDFNETTSALGDLVIAFQTLENSLLRLFCRLVCTQDVEPGIIIGSQISFKNLILLTDALCRYRTQDEATLAELAEIAKLAGEHEITRNRFMHSHYDIVRMVHDKIEVERIKRNVRLGKGFVPVYETYDPSKVHDAASAMLSLSKRIDSFHEILVAQGIIELNQ